MEEMQKDKAGPADFIYIGLSAAGALLVLLLFWQDLNRTLTRFSEKPLAAVSWKYRAVQRRFPNRVLWDRLRQESPVYAGDFIRTAERSEATVHFEDKLHLINIHESTLIQIVSAGQVQQGIRSAPELRLYEGSAELWQGDERRILQAEQVSLLSAGRIVLLKPRTQAKYLNIGREALTVPFSWESGEKETTLDIAKDRQFTQMIHRQNGGTAAGKLAAGTEQLVPLDSGVYYWRLYPTDQGEMPVKAGAVSGRLQIVQVNAPVLIRPLDGERFRFRTDRPGIRFQWKTTEEASVYLVELFSANSALLRSLQIQSPGGEVCSTVMSGLPPGSYSWRVRPLYGRDFEGTPPQSLSAFFTIEASGELSVPQPLKKQEAIYLGGDETRRYFSWKPEDDAAYYTFLFSIREDLKDPLIAERVRDNYYALDIRQAQLAPGEYYWGVYQTGSNSDNSMVSPAQPVVILAGAPPVQTRPLVTPGTPAPVVRTAPLAAPKLRAPLNEQIFTEEGLIQQNRTITFVWDSVEGASAYELILYHVQPASTVMTFRTTITNGTSYKLTDLTVLDRGLFRWQLNALDGERRGQAAAGNFAIDVGHYEAAEGQESGVLFGND
ncbi:hypothetical protein AGMMS50230_10150 [Spirochaetia bacterium]|nr:hypothetical protein AGMMS50230_10150 [Spirochaetia bacterium]